MRIAMPYILIMNLDVIKLLNVRNINIPLWEH